MAEEVELCVEIGANNDPLEAWVEKADINQLCRACANTHENMIPIFEGDGLEHDLQAKIDKHFPINISKDDGLPHQMCFQCASTLVAWHDMYTGCIDAEKKLKNLLKKSEDGGQVKEEGFQSSIVTCDDLASGKTKSQRKIGSEMEVDDDYDDDDDDDRGDDEIETEEVVLHKLDAKKKENTVELGGKGTTIRDQIMVMRNDIGQMQLISMALHMNENIKTLELSSNSPVSSDFKEKKKIIKAVVRHLRENCGLSDNETLAMKWNCIQEETDSSKSNSELNLTKIDKESTRLRRMRLSIAERSYYCTDCNLRFRFSHNFEAHMKTHESVNEKAEVGNEENMCEDSSDLPSGGNSISQERNMMTAVGQCGGSSRQKRPNRYCELCNKYFTTRGGLNYHKKHVHLGIKNEECDICGRCFAMKAALNEHRRIHTGERPFVCQVCGKAVRTSALLFCHLRSHSDVRPHVCEVCNAAFKFLHTLKKHIEVVHSGERNFVCDKCGKKFSGCSDLKRHVLIHSGLKPYQCHICFSNFNQGRYLKNHLHGKHQMELKDASAIVKNIKILETEQPSAVLLNITSDGTDEAMEVLKNVKMNETGVQCLL